MVGFVQTAGRSTSSLRILRVVMAKFLMMLTDKNNVKAK
jgi:hypothetical protein